MKKPITRLLRLSKHSRARIRKYPESKGHEVKDAYLPIGAEMTMQNKKQQHTQHAHRAAVKDARTPASVRTTAAGSPIYPTSKKENDSTAKCEKQIK
jgi:hypothetical protein